MKLIYRGNSYEYNADRTQSAQSFRAPYTVMYRGVTMQIDPQAQMPARSESYDLSYRGTRYRLDRDNQGRVNLTTLPANRKPTQIFSPQREAGRLHHTNLLNNLQRRLQAAQVQGDQTLIDLLEAERRQITSL
ncbi:DUF4278 domain-containing protein [Phormidesmis sp. 146-35]